MPQLDRDLEALLSAAVGEQLASAGSAVVLHQSQLIGRAAVGTLASRRADGSRVGSDELEPAGPHAWFDLASLTKLYSAITLHTLVERGRLGHDEPICTYLAGFRGDCEREKVTLRHLLTHTSGLPDIYPDWQGRLDGWLATHPDEQVTDWPLADRDQIRESITRLPLTAPVGRQWVYSCVGYNTAMLYAEAATGQVWADLVASALEAMKVTEVSFSPPAQVAATEIDNRHHRGVIRGQVHDEFSWSLGGRCANAGLFGTAWGVAATAEALRLDALPCARDNLWTNQLPALLGREVADPHDAPFGHSMGLRMGQTSWMSAQGSQARGHTGFTGTSVFTDAEAELTVVVLTNRVHPNRSPDITGLRAAIAELAYRSVG